MAQQACLVTYNQTLDELQAREAACLALPPDQDPPNEQAACLREVNQDRKKAGDDLKFCENKARVANKQCEHDCSASPSTP
jgi:hypothetical protein